MLAMAISNELDRVVLRRCLFWPTYENSRGFSFRFILEKMILKQRN